MEEKNKKILLWVLDLGINIAIILVLVLVIQKWIIAPFDVFGASMCDTLNQINGECKKGYGEKIIINEATYVFNDPDRGEIVVFLAPGYEDKYFIKRVIGLPGDKVEVKNGNVYVNDIEINEPYLSVKNKGKTEPYFGNLTEFHVPTDHYFLLGDNRNESTDSRSCFSNPLSVSCVDDQGNAYVSKESIRGKAWLTWWPLSKMRILDTPSYPELQEVNSESLEEK